MTQVESKLSEKVDIENNTKINDCKEDIMMMAFIEILIYLQEVNYFRFKTIARGGFWIDPWCIRLLNKQVYSLVKQALVLKCYRFHFKVKNMGYRARS